MNLLDIILLAVALAMDCFTVSIVSGVLFNGQWTMDNGQLSTRSNNYPLSIFHFPLLRMAFLFGFFQAMMPLLGWLGISHFQAYMEAYDHWIAFGLLGFIGGKMIWESFGDEEDQHFNPSRLRTQLLLAIATSIDALAIGISFACTGFTELSQLTMPLLIIGIVSFLFSIVGYHLGRRFGKTITRRIKPELLGGVILILIGVKILITHLF
jgi:putative Mn2+ efflux pump MntP